MEEESLRQIAAQRAQGVRLRGGLNALRCSAQAEGMGERDDGRQQRTGLRIAGQAGHERAVDLDLGDGQPLQRAQRRGAGPEVVEGEAHAERGQPAQGRRTGFQIVTHRALDDLEKDHRGVDAGAPERAGDGLDEVRMGGLARRQVDRRDQAGPAQGVTAGLLEHPGADRDDQPGLLGRGDEVGGVDQSALGMVPAHERLGAADGAAGQLDLGQEAQHELAALDRPAQRELGLVAARGARAHAVVEDLVDPAATLLGAVHRGVGLADERVGVLGAQRRQGDADARADVDLVAAQRERRAQRLGDALGDPDRVALAGDVLAQDGELVAAEPRGGVARPQHAGQARGHRAQQLVAGGVAHGVVDRLEAVEVEEEDGERRRVAAEARERLAEAVDEQGAVGQAGEVVVHRLVREPCLEALALDGQRDRVAQGALVDAALDQHVLRALADGLQGERVVVGAGEHEDRHVQRGRAHMGERLEAARVGQVQVEQDARERAVEQPRDALGDARRVDELVRAAGPVGAELGGGQPGAPGIVLDEQDRRALHGQRRGCRLSEIDRHRQGIIDVCWRPAEGFRRRF